MTDYLLPQHASLDSLDPLDVCGDAPEVINEHGRVQHKHIIDTLLNVADADFVMIESRSKVWKHDWASRFGVLIEDIAYSLHNVGDLDTAFLQDMLAEQSQDSLVSFRRNLFTFARLLEHHFPQQTLEFLGTSNKFCSLTPSEVDTLLSHLILGTVQIPHGNEWGRPGFTSLYRANPVVPSAVTGYLTTLIDHFTRGGYSYVMDSGFRFSWTFSETSCNISPEVLSARPEKAARITPVVKKIASEPTPLATATTFVLLSAHSQPGPGPAGTHEERLMGQSPALAITPLVCPKLAVNAALITSKFPVHAQWEGHNRYAKLMKIYGPQERVFRRYIVADAAELDVADHDGVLPDLKPGVIEREIGKLEAGFGGRVRLVAIEGQLEAHEMIRIEVVPWGCQAFGGNLIIKAQCMMIAGGLAGVEVIHLLVSSDREDQAREIQSIAEKKLTVGDMFKSLRP